MSLIYDSNGQRVSTGPLLGKGGEGSVFEVPGRQNIVAKVYHTTVAPRHAAKLTAMVRLRTERLQRLSAWPLEILHERPGGPVIGLLMPRATGKQVHLLYGPKSRLVEFPTADWRFLVHTASNIARAFHAVHEHGHVIGDVNHANLMISDRATVMLIDCDSFQINLPDDRFLCEVGIETHTPPELQGKRFREVPRTPNHDNFGLAVLIFQLLFMGRHPFSGTYLGAGETPPIPKAITEFRFAYGPNASSRQMRPPPGTLALEATSSTLAGLFERAFSNQGTQFGARPRAQDWVSHLENLSKALKLCTKHNGHYYLNTLSCCPWCEVEGRIGILLFNFPIVSSPGQTQFDLVGVWKRITDVIVPGIPPPLPTRPTGLITPSPHVVALGHQYRQGLGWITTYLGMNKQRTQSIANIQAAIQSAQTRCGELTRRWQTEVSDDAFQKKLQELEKKRSDYLNLSNLRAQKMNELERNRERAQRQQYLDGISLQSADIPNIGFGRKATLQSFGIATAGDVTEYKILAVPGFGPTLTGYLMSWRRSVEQHFRFNPTKGINAADIAALDAMLNQSKIQLERDLTQGAVELKSISEQIQQKRSLLVRSMEEALMAVAQGEANLKVI